MSNPSFRRMLLSYRLKDQGLLQMELEELKEDVEDLKQDVRALGGRSRLAGYRSQFETPPGLTDEQEMLWDRLMMVAVNDGAAYAKRDAKSALTNAVNEVRRERAQEFRSNVKEMKRAWIKSLEETWARQDSE